SVPFIFQLIKDTKHDGEEFHYEVGMLTQLQNYDTYAKLYNMLKTKAGKLISSSFTNPLWDGNKNRFNDISGKKRMLLLRTNGSESTDRIHAMTNTEPLSIVVLGYYDNIIISDSIKKAKKFLASFDSYLKKDKHDSKAFNIMVIPYKSLYKWEN
ncbi:MAG: hypothetical protein NTV89_18790, partial [Proteobacteria bacterium]|nr:hypothetical protein [Pseudomonadota bacterium]